MSTSFRAFLLVFLLVLCLMQAAPATGGSNLTESELVTSRSTVQPVVFVPQSVFDSKHLDDLPTTVRESLAFRLDVQRRPDLYARNFRGGGVPDCWPADPTYGQGTAEHTVPLDELIANAGDVYVGKVVEVVAGWDVRQKRVARFVEVNLEKQIQGGTTTGAEVPGQRTAVLVEGGSISVDGTRLCNEPREGFYTPQVEDTVLLAGGESDLVAGLFEGYIFPVAEGRVGVQPIRGLDSSQEAMELHVLEVLLEDRTERDFRRAP